MDVLGFAKDFAGNSGKAVFMWAAGGAIAALAYNAMKNEIKKLGDGVLLQINDKISNVDDPDLKEMIRHGIKYAAKRFPEASGADKLKIVVKAVQDATPNWLVSDDKVREVIESEYNRIKSELENV